MIKYKRLINLITASFLVTNTLIGAVPPVVGFHSLNNSSEGTYKTDDSLLDKIISKLGLGSNFNEKLNYSESKDLNTSNSTLSYLIENDLITKDLNVNKDSLFSNSSLIHFDYSNADSLVNRSDFLVTLAKAVYGVQESRPIVYRTSSSRVVGKDRIDLVYSNKYTPSGFDEYLEELGDGEIDFSKGDYVVYVTPNVYEMYFKTLLDKGALNASEFSNVQFIEDYQNYGKSENGVKYLPIWSNELDAYLVGYDNRTPNVSIYGENPLGQEFKFKEGNVSSSNVSWLFEEDIRTIDALKYIESLLRLTEKDMTETEANLVTFKYGVNYISNIPSEDASTVKFLIAKGVLNFEEENDFNELYKPLNMKFFLKLIYRIHNKNARFDFSSIQLTDNDNYWLSKGFSLGSLKLIASGEYPHTETLVTESVAEVSSNGFLKSRTPVLLSGTKEYTVERTFYNGVTYYYKGDKVTESLKTGDEVAKVESVKSSSGSVVGVKVTFKIKAASEQAAVAILDAYTHTENSEGVDLGTIPTVNKVINGKKEITYVSQDALVNLKSKPIKVIEDKYLINTETGARALLLNDNKIAIVGNEVILTDDNIVFGLNGEVHYNFEIIAKLLSQAMIDEIEPNSAYLTVGAPEGDSKYKLKSANGSDLGTTYAQKFAVKEEGNSNASVNRVFYNISQNNLMSNFLIKNVKKDLGLKKDAYMVVEFKYVVNNNVASGMDDTAVNSILNTTISMKNMLGWIYTKPGDANLLRWWEENISFNNSLVNYVMNTKNVNYMKSGFMVPKISILTEETDSLKNEKLESFFGSTVGASLNGYSSFLKGFFMYNNMNNVNDGLSSLRVSRTLDVLGKLDAVNSANYSNYGNYLVTKSGQVYKNADNDANLIVDSGGKTITQVERKYGTPSYRDNALYQFRTSEGKLLDYVCMSVAEYGIVNMSSTEAVKTKYKDGNLFLESDENKNYIDYVKEINKSITEDYNDATGLIVSAGRPPDSYLKEDGIYYMDGLFYERKNGKVDEVGTTTPPKNGKTVYAFPRFAFEQAKFKPDSSNVIDRENNFPFLDMGTIMNYGITSHIIDSIVQFNSNYLTTSTLPQGATVVLGDVQFVKKGNNLVSPILSITSISSKYSSIDLGNGTDASDNVKALVSETLGTLSVTMMNNGVIENGQLLSSYVTSCSIGSGTGESNFIKALVRENGSLMIKDGNDKVAYGSGGYSFATYSISIKLDNAVKFRPVDENNKLYALVTTTNVNGEGYVNNMPYYRETLSFADLEKFTGKMNKSLYTASKYSDQLMRDFRDLFSLKQQEDFISLIKYYIRIVCAWLTIFNILVAFIKHSILDVFITDIRYPNGSDRNGVDIYKILTLGFQDVDTKIGIPKTILISFMFFVVMVFVSL